MSSDFRAPSSLSKSRPLTTFSCKMVAIENNLVAEKKNCHINKRTLRVALPAFASLIIRPNKYRFFWTFFSFKFVRRHLATFAEILVEIIFFTHHGDQDGCNLRVLGYLKYPFQALCLTWLQQSTAALETWYIRLQHGENKSSSTTRQSFRRFERVLTCVSSLIIRRREYITSRMKNAHVFPKPSGRSFKRRRTKSLYMDRTLLFS